MRERVREPWFWALVGVSCWTVIVATASCVLYLLVAGFCEASTAAEYLAAARCFVPVALPILAALLATPWFLLAARKKGWL
jgi:ABC-type sugar transport system permease subunit